MEAHCFEVGGGLVLAHGMWLRPSCSPSPGHAVRERSTEEAPGPAGVRHHPQSLWLRHEQAVSPSTPTVAHEALHTRPRGPGVPPPNAGSLFSAHRLPLRGPPWPQPPDRGLCHGSLAALVSRGSMLRAACCCGCMPLNQRHPVSPGKHVGCITSGPGVCPPAPWAWPAALSHAAQGPWAVKKAPEGSCWG